MQYAKRLIKNAKQELADLDIAKDAQTVLISMADFFIERTS
jgi:geranylgeranyl pyrophosphate synthase